MIYERIPGEGLWIPATLETPGEWYAVECRCCHRLLDVDQVDDDNICETCPSAVREVDDDE